MAGCAFQYPVTGSEHLVIAAEVRTEHGPDKVTNMDFSTIIGRIGVVEMHGLHVTDFRWYRPEVQTTSGRLAGHAQRLVRANKFATSNSDLTDVRSLRISFKMVSVLVAHIEMSSNGQPRRSD